MAHSTGIWLKLGLVRLKSPLQIPFFSFPGRAWERGYTLPQESVVIPGITFLIPSLP
jgi:hypothetical protein